MEAPAVVEVEKKAVQLQLPIKDHFLISIEKKDLEALKAFLDLKQAANLSAADKNELLNKTALKNKEMFALLWNAGFRFLNEEQRDRSFHMIIVADNRPVIEFLVAADQTNNYLNRFFREAIALKKDDLALWLWKQKKADIAFSDAEKPNNTPMHVAAMSNPDFIDLLVKDLSEQEIKERMTHPNDYGSYPLHCAAATGQESAARKILLLKAAVDPVDKYGNTPLIRAARSGSESVAKVLIAYRANILHENKKGHSALTVPRDSWIKEDKHARVIAYFTRNA